jgi:cytochrome oxidase Cu insertion factor (SCO1/SenC/PrrC family)
VTSRRALLGASVGAAAWRANAATDAQAGAPVRGRVDVSRLPAPGTYRLLRVMPAPDGVVLDTEGRRHRLHALLRGRATVLSFMYTYCRDPEGCPRAWAAMDTLFAALHREAPAPLPAQLISLSFDPSNDTPAQMRLFGGERLRDPTVPWHFLTTGSVAALLPLLSAFGQDVTVETDATGRPTRTLNHLLKLFLVDAQLQVREIYSVATLDALALLNDLRTLQLEAARRSP